MNTLLIVDDEKNVLSSFRKILEMDGYRILTASSAEEGLSLAVQDNVDLLIMDIRMQGMSGLEAFSKFKKIDPKLPVIIMTAFGTTETAIEAMKIGAYDYVIKPMDVVKMKELISRALEAGRLMRTNVDFNSDPDSPGDRIIGSSPNMQEIYKKIGQVAGSDVTVLLRGESGTGKELIARAIYHHSQRKDKPLVVINAAAIPETLLESELFGYEKGAFTDARERRIGKLEQCDGGTLFLDEIGDMPMSIQSKLLRVLEDQPFERLGGRQSIKTDIRFITATNRDLEDLVRQGQFREDLYYRLNVVTLTIPSLRERKEDIALLVQYFIKRYRLKFRTDISRISPQALSVLHSYDWPGNVRELENVIQKALLLGKGNVIMPEDILISVETGGDRKDSRDVIKKMLGRRVRLAIEKNEETLYSMVIQEIETALISEVLAQTQGNQTRAARVLGVSRPTLKDKIEKFGIRREIRIQEA